MVCQGWWAGRNPQVSRHLTTDEPVTLVLPYAPLFLLFYHSLFITDPLPCNMLTQPPAQHVQAFITTCAWYFPLLNPLPVAPSAQLCVLDGQMTYIPNHCNLSISRQVPCHFPLFWFHLHLIISSCIMQWLSSATQLALLWTDWSQVIVPCG